MIRTIYSMYNRRRHIPVNSRSREKGIRDTTYIDSELKKNKEIMYNTSNNILLHRDNDTVTHTASQFGRSNHNMNINRLLMERDGFNVNTTQNVSVHRPTQRNKEHQNDYNKYRDFGEITGASVKSREFDNGMPVRSGYQQKTPVLNPNSYLDFDLYNTDKSLESDVKYNDTLSGGFCNINDSAKIISDKLDPTVICMDGISSINLFLYNNIQKVSQDSFNIDGLSLYMTFAVLFYGSDGNSHIELKKYFGYPEKNIVNDEIANFITRNAKYIYPYFSFRSYVINDRFIPLSKNFAKQSNIVPFIPVNISSPQNEADRLNAIFERETGAQNIISKKTLQKTQISVVNISRLTPVWGIHVSSVVMNKFMGIKTQFLQFVGQSVGLFEDADKLIIEIPMKGLKMLFGVILYKDSLKGMIDQSDIEMAISNMKETVVDTILLPKIVKRVKMRLNNMLDSTGLNVIFIDTDLPKIYPERGGNLNNIVQYCDIIIDEKSVASKKINGGSYQSMRKIVVDRSFTYYVRYAPEKVILSMGYID